jgi:hypothetical protein
VKLLVSGSTGTLRRLLPRRPDRLGVLMVPGQGNRVGWWPAGTYFACDNRAYKGLDAVLWLRFLAKLAKAGERPLWLACPDVVGDAAGTWRAYELWSPVMRDLGLPVALVLQDGVEGYGHRGRLTREINEGRLAAVFVGGSTAWKEGPHPPDLCRQAKEAGLQVHVGRVNSARRVLHFARRAHDLGYEIDTIDGGTAIFGDANIPGMVRAIDRALGTGTLVGGLR